MIVDGKAIARDLEHGLADKLAVLPKKRVAFVLIGENPVGRQYVGMKTRIAERLGIETKTFSHPDVDDTGSAMKLVSDISADGYDGIVVQLPLPEGIDAEAVLSCVPVRQDIDVISGHARQALREGRSNNLPPVARSVFEILSYHDVHLSEKNIVIVGRGRLVGEPVSECLERMSIHPDMIDRDTDDGTKSRLLVNADIVISGAGVPGIIQPDMVRQGVILIDAGTSEQHGKVVGDIDPACAGKASLFSTTPGGIGPITIVSLFTNLL